MNLDELGYYLYMSKKEKEKKQDDDESAAPADALQKSNVKGNDLQERLKTTT